MQSPGTLFTVSAPSGAGKTSLVEALAQIDGKVCVSISHTTRTMRPGEQDGVNYHFVTEASFQEMLSRNAFLEHARVYQHFYGTSQAWVEEKLRTGDHVILEIDWQGAQQIKRQRPDSVAIFILPPSRTALEQRLNSRGQDDASVIAQRMDQAVDEISHYPEADFIVVNDDFELALVELQCIVDSQGLQTESQIIRHQSLLTELLS
jgi:guanylate kinase